MMFWVFEVWLCEFVTDLVFKLFLVNSGFFVHQFAKETDILHYNGINYEVYNNYSI